MKMAVSARSLSHTPRYLLMAAALMWAVSSSCQTLSLRSDTSGIAVKPYPLAVRTNLLYDCLVLPTVGAELYIGKNYTIGADWFYTWFKTDRRHRYWQSYGGYLTLRKYLNPKLQKAPDSQPFVTGHHIGVYMLGMTYDVEFGNVGYQARRFGFGGGIEYGYSKFIDRRLQLDCSIGLGFQDGEYKKYKPDHGCYVWQSTHKRHWFGPTKAEISLKWILGKKGGAR